MSVAAVVAQRTAPAPTQFAVQRVPALAACVQFTREPNSGCTLLNFAPGCPLAGDVDALSAG
ncbi:MAG: hypothetical protein ACPGUV_03305 [Polyangiales bacterium]